MSPRRGGECAWRKILPKEQENIAVTQRVESFLCSLLFVGGWRDLCSSLGRSFILSSSSCEHVLHAVVSLIAGVLKYGTVGLGGRHFCLPRLGPRVRVVNREFITNRFISGASQAFGHFYILA